MTTKTFEKLPAERQVAILDASARVFASKGYFQAGIDEICEAAQISNGALYKYFVNKEGLYKTVARRTLDLILLEYSQFVTGGGSFWEILPQILEKVFPFATSHRDYFIIFMDLGSPSMDAFSSQFTDQFERQTFEYYADIIDIARERGDIRDGITTETAAYLIDNHLMLLAYSCVSEHYNRRFHQYFGYESGQLDITEKIGLIMRSFRELLM